MIESGIITLLLALTALLSVLLMRSKKRLQAQKEDFGQQLDAAKRNAEEAARAKDTFLANISHETRTPMNAIIGLSHILLKTDLSYEQKTNLFKIKRSAEHLLSITNDILDYSKLEAGKLFLENIEIDANGFFGHLSDLITPSAVEKQLDLIFDLSPRLPERWTGDPLRLTQILLNLLNNAVKFTEEGSVILRVNVREDEHGTNLMLFEIIDTGIGMSEPQQKNLFQAFGQADSSISRKYGGTGLGLAISGQLASMMEAQLGVTSRLGEGSTFSLALPMNNGAAETATSNRLSIRLLDTKSILIIDQCPENAAVLASILSHYGAEPKIAESHGALRRLLDRGHYDAICIDSRLIGSLPRIQQLTEKSDALVLLQYEVLPGSTVKSFPADAVLQKPFTPALVESIMNDVFGKAIINNNVTKERIDFEDIRMLNGARILLVEDNEGNAMVVEGLLEGSGIALDVAPNGRKAVEAVLNGIHSYDMILMDINMPIMDGYAATSILREYQKYDNIPIIAMTANITESDMNKMKSIGMQDFVAKPVDVQHFYAILLSYIPPKAEAAQQTRQRTDNARSAAGVSDAKSVSFSLPGVDVNSGVQRLNGNMQAYLKVLLKFHDSFKEIASRLAEAVHRNDAEEGRQLAHNLKGLSGNIGADEIYKRAAAIENGFKTGNRNLLPAIETLDKKLSVLLAAIAETVAENPAENAEAKETISPAALSGVLDEMLGNARKRKALALKQQCEQLQRYAWPPSYKASLDDIIRAANAYDYAKVIKTIESI